MTVKKIDLSPPSALPTAPKSITWRAWLVAFSASLAFSISPSVGRAAILSGMDSTELLVGRFGLGVLLIWLTMAVRKSKRAQDIDLYGVVSICFVGFVNGIGMLFFFFALTRLDASIRLLLYAAIRRIGSAQMSLMMPLETLIAISWAVLFLGERLTPIQTVGGALIIASAVLAIERRKMAG